MYKDFFSCSGKVAVVTGGSGLIGRHIVAGLHEFGATVYNADVRNDETLNLRQIQYLYFDITREDSVRNGLSNVIEETGRIDILVNSAYPRTSDWGSKFEQVHFDSWKRNVNDHMGGYFICCKQAAEQMKRQGGGVIINLASIYGVVAPDFTIYEETDMTMPVAYAAIKAGIIAFTKYIASYYGNQNVRANSISLGGVFDGQPPQFVERYCRKTMLGRMANPQDVVGAVIYLASDAAAYVTGHNLMVDGGWTAL